MVTKRARRRTGTYTISSVAEKRLAANRAGYVTRAGTHEQQPQARAKLELRGPAVYGAKVAGGLSLGYTHQFTSQFENEYLEQYRIDNKFLNWLAHDSMPLAFELGSFMYTPTGWAFKAGSGALKTGASMFFGGRLPQVAWHGLGKTWSTVGKRHVLTSFDAIFKSRFMRSVVRPGGGAFKGTPWGRRLARRFANAGYSGSLHGLGHLGAMGPGHMLSTGAGRLHQAAQQMNPVDWAGKWFGHRLANTISPKLYQQMGEVLRQSGGRIVVNAAGEAVMHVPKGKYYGEAKRIMRLFKNRAGRAGLKLPITHAAPQGQEVGLQSFAGAMLKGRAKKMARGLGQPLETMGGFTGMGAGFGAVNPEGYTGEAGATRLQGAIAGAKLSAPISLAFTAAHPLIAAAWHGTGRAAAQLSGRLGGFEWEGAGGTRRPQMLLGASSRRPVVDGEVVTRPDPSPGIKTPRQSIHNTEPEPPRMRMPLTGSPQTDFLRITGVNLLDAPVKLYERMLYTYPELEAHRQEMDAMRLISKSMDQAYNSAGQLNVDQPPKETP